MSTTSSLDIPRPSAAGMSLLSFGVPLSLLMDLAYGPRSRELLVHEKPSVPDQRPPAA